MTHSRPCELEAVGWPYRRAREVELVLRRLSVEGTVANVPREVAMSSSDVCFRVAEAVRTQLNGLARIAL